MEVEIANKKILEVGITALKIDSARQANHSPHPFCIGSKHIANSPGMYLDPNSAPCEMRTNQDGSDWATSTDKKKGITYRCDIPYDQHTSDTIVLVELLEDITLEKFQELFGSPENPGLLGKIFESNNICGLNLLKTHPQFKII